MKKWKPRAWRRVEWLHFFSFLLILLSTAFLLVFMSIGFIYSV